MSQPGMLAASETSLHLTHLSWPCTSYFFTDAGAFCQLHAFITSLAHYCTAQIKIKVTSRISKALSCLRAGYLNGCLSPANPRQAAITAGLSSASFTPSPRAHLAARAELLTQPLCGDDGEQKSPHLELSIYPSFLWPGFPTGTPVTSTSWSFKKGRKQGDDSNNPSVALVFSLISSAVLPQPCLPSWRAAWRHLALLVWCEQPASYYTVPFVCIISCM